MGKRPPKFGKFQLPSREELVDFLVKFTESGKGTKSSYQSLPLIE